MNKLCSCGMPQSSPIPHEHDQTERERQIIAYYKELNNIMYEALKGIEDAIKINIEMNGVHFYKHWLPTLRKALNKAEGRG